MKIIIIEIMIIKLIISRRFTVDCPSFNVLKQKKS